MAAVAVVAVVAGASALPSVLGTEPKAISWQPEPATLTGDARAAAITTCFHLLTDLGSRDINRLVDADPVLAEDRGGWALVVFADRAGETASCISPIGEPGSDDLVASHSGATTAPGAREVRPASISTSTLGGKQISVAIGRAGTDVVAVSYDSRSSGMVEATVTNGWFALWVPGADMTFHSLSGVPVTLTLRDGTTETVTLGS